MLLDVVYNHAGGGFDEDSLWFLDRLPKGNNNDSLYFTDQGWAGGLGLRLLESGCTAVPDRQRELITTEEYRVDGFRFDEVSVMDRFGGWPTCQYMTDTLRSLQAAAPLRLPNTGP